MMLTIPRLTQTVRLAEYHQGFGEQTLTVWVNPPLRLLEQLTTVTAETRPEAVCEVFAELWSQDADRWTVEDVRNLIEVAGQTDPGLWSWLCSQTVAAIAEHRQRTKKV